jgi:hypothetical protein
MKDWRNLAIALLGGALLLVGLGWYIELRLRNTDTFRLAAALQALEQAARHDLTLENQRIDALAAFVNMPSPAPSPNPEGRP